MKENDLIKWLSILCLAVLLLLPSAAFAEVRTVEADGLAIMGDGPAESVPIVQERAKKKALGLASDMVGVFVEHYVATQNHRLTKSETQTMSSAILRVISESFTAEVIGDNVIQYRCHIVAEADDSIIDAFLANRQNFDEMAKRQEERNASDAEVEREYVSLKQQYKEANTEEQRQTINQKVAANEKAFAANRQIELGDALLAQYTLQRWSTWMQGGKGKWNWGSLMESGIEETLFGYYQQAINENPSDPAGYIRLAKANLASCIANQTPYDDPDATSLVPKVKAIKSLLQKALELNPNSADAYFQRAEFRYQEMGLDTVSLRGVAEDDSIKIEKGISDARRAVELNPDDANAYILLGDFYLAKCEWEIGSYGTSDMDFAWKLFMQARDKAKNSQEQAKVYYSMGKWYYQSGYRWHRQFGTKHIPRPKEELAYYQKSISCFEKAIALDPSMFLAYYRRADAGESYDLASGRDEKARHEAFKRWTEKSKQVIEEQLAAAEAMYQYLMGEDGSEEVEEEE